MNTSSVNRARRPRRDPELIPAIQSGSSHQMITRVERLETRGHIGTSRFAVSPCTGYSCSSSAKLLKQTSSPDSPLLPCSICFQDMHPKKRVRASVLPCGHAFCNPCIKKWINTKNLCPSCRRLTLSSEIRQLYL